MHEVRRPAQRSHGATMSISVLALGLLGCGLFIFAVLTFGEAQAQSAVNHYYVSPTGSDSNSGTSPSTPWQTIAHADQAIQLGEAGTVIHLAPGTYESPPYFFTTSSGTANARITWVSDVKWGAILNSGWYLIGDYNDIGDIQFTGSRINAAIFLRGNLSRAIGNYVHDIGAGCHSTGAIVLAGDNDAAEANIVANLSVGYLDLTVRCNQYHAIYSSMVGSVIRNNIVSGAPGWGIHSWHDASDLIIENNTVFNNGLGGILIGNGENDAGPYVHNNTTVANNIVVNNGWGIGPLAGIVEYPCGDAIGANNMYLNNAVYDNGPQGDISLCDGKSPSGTVTLDATSFASLFVKYQADGSGDYHLQTNSAAIDKGTTACALGISNCAPGTDYDGNRRPSGSAYDIGAYEYGGSF